MNIMPRNQILEFADASLQMIAVTTSVANSYRLDASAFISAGGSGSIVTKHDSGLTLSDLADIFTVYIQTPILYFVTPFVHSRPYLTTSELGEYQWGESTHVSILADPRLMGWQIQRNTIVLSRSGRVGEAYWVDNKLAGALVGDSFRVIPRDEKMCYFLYALLSSEYAREYMSGSTYGSVVEHASVQQVRSLPVPTILDSKLSRIGELVRQAIEAREDAYAFLDSAKDRLLHANGLSELHTARPATFDPIGQPECFTTNALNVEHSAGIASDYRLDAHFYNPTAQMAVANIKKCPGQVKAVGEIAKVLFTGGRFKRNYVDKAHGVPFLSGKNVVQIRPTDLKYLSNLQEFEIKELCLKKGWTLVTRSGTIGRTCFVWENYEKYLASEDLLRVIPDESVIDPGYLHAFLSSSYGHEQILRYRHGSVIDHVTPEHIDNVLIPCPSERAQEAIGDMVRKAYEKRAEAIRLEDQAQEIVMKEIRQGSNTRGA